MQGQVLKDTLEVKVDRSETQKHQTWHFFLMLMSNCEKIIIKNLLYY